MRSFKFESDIEQITSTRLVTCNPTDSLIQVTRQMRTMGCGSVVVVDQSGVVGIWTESDALKLDVADPVITAAPIRSFMSSPVVTIDRGAELSDLDRIFVEKGIRHCLVVSTENKPYGIVSKSDFVYALGVEMYLSSWTLGNVSLDRLPPVNEDTCLPRAIRIMEMTHSDAIVVVDANGHNKHIFSKRDLVNHIAENQQVDSLKDLDLGVISGVAISTSLLQALKALQQGAVDYLQVFDDNQKPLGFIGLGVIHKIIELEYVSHLKDSLEGSNKALQTSSEHLQLANRVIEASLNSIMITDTDGRIVSVNPSFTRTTGYQQSEVVGKTPAILKSGIHDQAFYADMMTGLHTVGSWEGEIWNRRRNGEIYAEWLSITPIHNEYGQVTQFASIFNDITRQKEIEEENLRLVLTDELTGLPNRRTFSERLKVALAHAERHQHKLAVMVVGIDHYRRIYSTLGRLSCEELIKQFSERLFSEVRSEDAVARLGEDEFGVLLPQVDDFGGAQRVIRIIKEFANKPFMVMDKEYYVTCSTGISFFPDETGTEELLKNADTAMLQAREAGSNNHRFYTESMDVESRRHLDMQSLLRIGLINDEFKLHYQPKISLSSDHLVSQEALLRWNSSKLGAISPIQFIPMAEKLGLIEEITRWVLREACTQNQLWMDSGFPENRMSVNISTVHVKRGTLVADVKRVLHELDYNPEHLDLEITESAFLENVDEASRILTQLRDLGISIAIDDFGTGYSNLSYLKKIPADILKIDQSFVQDLAESNDDQQITRAIIAMAHHLGLEVVAEGVETVQQLSLLNDYGCDQVQGFLFSKPLPASQFIEQTRHMNAAFIADCVCSGRTAELH